MYRKVNKTLAGPFLLLGIHCAYFDPNMLWEVKDISLVSDQFSAAPCVVGWAWLCSGLTRTL